jgi:hypothetical protein
MLLKLDGIALNKKMEKQVPSLPFTLLIAPIFHHTLIDIDPSDIDYT